MAQSSASHAGRLPIALSALKGIPFSWLKCGVLCSHLSAGILALPLLLLQPPPPAPPPPLEQVMSWEGEHRGKCVGLWGDPGSLNGSLLSAARPKPCAVCL